MKGWSAKRICEMWFVDLYHSVYSFMFVNPNAALCLVNLVIDVYV